MPRLIAFYLPQFYPTPENDEWWGKGFTEWTNVKRAKPLFKGHYQPRIPADELGYYDLRDPNVRIKQAELARSAGIEGFCYWHYWFAGRQLLNRVFDEVVQSGVPDYPFCLCWANHSWWAKTWDPDIPDRLLVEQTYPGREDYENHFFAMLPAFKDKRYIRVDGRLLFGIFEPAGIPDIEEFTETWNTLAARNDLPGFYFFAFAQGSKSLDAGRKSYDAIVYDAMHDAAFMNRILPLNKLKVRLNTILHLPVPMSYDFYARIALEKFNEYPEMVPCLVPNFDHSPRSGSRGVIIDGSTPEKWGRLCREVSKLRAINGKDGLIFIKAWNEWGEGNYLEPDSLWGKSFLEETKNAGIQTTKETR